jgi:hypothetical protein
MPRDLPTGLVALLKSGFAETHSTLAISLLGPGRSIKQTIYLATAAEGGASGPDVSLPSATAIAIPNAGFEAPVIPPPGYEYNPPGASWTFVNSGIIQGGTFAPPAAEGIQVGFITTTGSLSQALTGFVAGVNYDVKFKASRQYAADLPDFDVYLDAINLGRIAPTSAAFQQFSLPFAAGQTSYTLKFQGVNTAGETISVMIDDVQITPAAGGIGRPPGRGGVAYLPRLRSTGPVAMSLTQSADRCDVVIENIDRLAGNEFVAVQDALYGSFAEFGRLWRDLRNPANTYQVTLLTGQVVAARASETEVQLTLMSDIYSSGAIAGQIIYGRSCPWTFKDAATCAFVGPQSTCNKLLDDPDGCSGRSNEHHFGGFPYIKSVDTISGAAAIQQNLQYQTILTPASLAADELEAGARATTAIIQRHNLLLQGFTITDDAANDATKIVAGGVGGANYQTLKENDGYSYVRVLPPQPVISFNQSFKLTDDSLNGETDITTYGVPTGTLNLKTDFKASGQIAVTNIDSFNMSGIITVDSTLELQPGMGMLIEGAGVSGSDLIATVGSVSTDGKTYVLTASLPTAPTLGARVQADDTAAVQAWTTAHGDLALPPGYYRISGSIVVPTTSEGFSLVVHGSGWDLSVFAFQHGGDGFVPTLPNLKIDSLVFKDLTIATGTKWDTGGTIDANNHGYAVRMTAPGYLGIYNNFVLERCRVIGWGCFGLWSDNMEVSWINNCIFRENRFGHIAFVAPDQQETAKLPNANVLRSNALDQAFGGGDSDRTASGSMNQPVITPPATSPTPAQTDAARAISFSGVSLTAADRGRVVIVHGAGTNNSNLYSFIDVILTGSTAKLAHACQTTVSGAVVEILSSSIASIFLNRAHDSVIDGATIQGNFTTALPSTECNAIRADECYNLRIVGIHEEDAGGHGGAAVRLANCLSVNIENWGGTSAAAGATNAHNADFQLINSHGVSVRNAYFNDRPQFVIDGSSSGVKIDDAWVVGYNNLWQADASWDRLQIGSGVRTAQSAEARTNQLAGNEYSYDGFFGRDLLLNGQFLDGSDGFESWTKTSWATRTATSPFRGGTFVTVDATAIADNGGSPSTVLEQVVSIPDDAAPGLYILGFEWNLDAQNGVEQTGRFLEVRLHPSSGVDEAIQWSTRPFAVVQDTWQVGHVRCFVGTGTSRTVSVRVNVTPGPNNVVMRLANFRLASGKHIFGSWERGVSDFGGRMRAPLEFAPITNPPYPPPPAGSPYLSIVNIGGVLNQGKNGAYTPIGPGGSGTITGPPNYYAIFNSLGTGLDYAALKQETSTVHVINSILKIDQQRALTSVYTSSGLAATLALCDSDDVCYFGPEWSPSNTKGGTDVVIRAAHDDVSSLQIAGAQRRMTFNAPRALSSIAPPLPTFLLGVSDLNLDGLRIQQVSSGSYLTGYVLSTWFNTTADANFAVNPLGGFARFNNVSYSQWPANHGPGGTAVLTNNGSGVVSWAAFSGTAGHVIQDEGGPLTQMGALNFTGAGVLASNNTTFPRTDITIFTASVLQEGTVSVSAQHFGGHKYFHNGIEVYDDAGGLAVPLVVKAGTGAAATSGAHLQEWRTSALLAYIDTQPTLRLGIPGAASGILELCSDNASTNATLQLTTGVAPVLSQIVRFPDNVAAVGQVLQVLTSVSGVVRLTWATPASGGGNVSVTAPQGTDLFVPRWSGTSPTTVLVDSNILDKTSTTGTIQFTCNQLLFKRLDAVDISDFYMRGASGASAIWRFDRRAGGGAPNSIEDPANSAEAQLHFEPPAGGGPGPDPAFVAGNVKSWFQGGLRIRPTSNNTTTVGNAFEIRTWDDITKLTIDQNGNLGMIAGVTYTWPPSNVAGVLTNNGSGGLSWAAGSSGGITGTGTVGYLPRVKTLSGANVATIQDSALSDDGTNITVWRSMQAPIGTPINLGDISGHRFNAMYTTSGFWVDSVGTTKTNPSTIGFYPFATSGSPTGDESGQIFLYSPANRIQSGNQIRTVLGSYWGVELRGSRTQNTAVSAITGTTSDPCVSIISERTNVSVLVCNAPNGLSGAQLADFQVAGATKARVSNAGDFYGASFNTPATGVNGIAITSTAITISDASGAQSVHSVGSLKLNVTPDSIVFSPGHVGSATGVVYVSVNGAANTQIPFGVGTAQGDYLGWDTATSKWIRMAAPTGGGGANTALSNLASVQINATLNFDTDGAYNIGGDPSLAPPNNKRVGAIYIKNAFWCYSGGTSANPQACGFLDSAGGYSRLLVYGNGSVLQGGNGQRTQMTAFHSLEFRGNRRSTSAPGFTNIPGTDSSSVLVYLDASPAPDCIPLLVNTAQTITSDLFHCQMAGVSKFRIGAQGTIIAPTSGTRFGASEVQLSGGATYTLSPLIDRTVIIDTASQNCTVYLPVASTCRGQIFDVWGMRQIQKINNPGAATGSSNTITLVCQGSDSINGWGSSGLSWTMPGTANYKAVKLIADSAYDIWWLVPYNI